MPIELKLEFSSRMKETPLYSDKGKTFFGVWTPPKVILNGDEKKIKVTASLAGNLDLIAFKEYGDSSLWWAIALVNNIMNPPEEVVPGLEIVIPKLQNVRAALLADN